MGPGPAGGPRRGQVEEQHSGHRHSPLNLSGPVYSSGKPGLSTPVLVMGLMMGICSESGLGTSDSDPYSLSICSWGLGYRNLPQPHAPPGCMVQPSQASSSQLPTTRPSGTDSWRTGQDRVSESGSESVRVAASTGHSSYIKHLVCSSQQLLHKTGAWLPPFYR